MQSTLQLVTAYSLSTVVSVYEEFSSESIHLSETPSQPHVTANVVHQTLGPAAILHPLMLADGPHFCTGTGSFPAQHLTGNLLSFLSSSLGKIVSLITINMCIIGGMLLPLGLSLYLVSGQATLYFISGTHCVEAARQLDFRVLQCGSKSCAVHRFSEIEPFFICKSCQTRFHPLNSTKIPQNQRRRGL